MKNPLAFFFLVLLFAACYRAAKAPEFDAAAILPPDSMVAVLTDIHILEGIDNIVNKKDTAMADRTEKTLDIILNKYKIDRAAFEENLRYYAYHTEEYDKIYDQVIVNLSKLESETTVKQKEDAPEEDHSE
jgi:hypothetical protein